MKRLKVKKNSRFTKIVTFRALCVGFIKRFFVCEAADDDASLMNDIGKSFRFSAVQVLITSHNSCTSKVPVMVDKLVHTQETK